MPARERRRARDADVRSRRTGRVRRRVPVERGLRGRPRLRCARLELGTRCCRTLPPVLLRRARGLPVGHVLRAAGVARGHDLPCPRVQTGRTVRAPRRGGVPQRNRVHGRASRRHHELRADRHRRAVRPLPLRGGVRVQPRDERVPAALPDRPANRLSRRRHLPRGRGAPRWCRRVRRRRHRVRHAVGAARAYRPPNLATQRREGPPRAAGGRPVRYLLFLSTTNCTRRFFAHAASLFDLSRGFVGP